MGFVEYTNMWVQREVTQGRIMIGIGIVLLLVSFRIYSSQDELLRGTLIPLGLLILILVGYGGFILYDRPAHAKESIALYEESKAKAREQEKSKHSNDNKAGNNLLRYVYPALMAISAISLFFIKSPYYRGMALGFIVLFVATYIIDNGFVSRSDAFLTFLKNS